MRRFPHAIAAVATVAIACGSFGEDGGASGPSNDGGVTGDALASDASSSDDGGVERDGGSSRDAGSGCPTGAILCDDFQSKSVAPWQTSGGTTLGGGTLLAASENENYFLRSHQPARTEAPNGAIGSRPLIEAIVPGTLAVRARVRIPINPPNNAHVLQFLAKGAPDDLFVHSLVVSDQDHWAVELYTLDGGYDVLDVPTDNPPPLGVWTCVEMVIALSAGSQSPIQLYVNDVLALNTERPTLDAFTSPFPPTVAVRAGLVTSEEVPADVDFDIDDVVVTTSGDLGQSLGPRIGCPKN